MRRVDIATQAKIIRSIIRTVMGSVCVREESCTTSSRSSANFYRTSPSSYIRTKTPLLVVYIDKHDA